MIYVTSDLHGYPLEQFRELLDRVGFSDEDYLFVLGDVIDRGKHGAQWLRWLPQQSNVQLILGNHEQFLLSCQHIFEEMSESGAEMLVHQDNIQILSTWIANGANPTLSGLHQLLKEDPDVVEGILDYLRDAPLYEDLEVNGRRFILVHAGLGNFHPDKSLDEYTEAELTWERPTLKTRYYDDATVIFGHTPTMHIAEEYTGKAIKTDTWTCIDTGAAGGHSPMLLRLDDMQEFYIQ